MKYKQLNIHFEDGEDIDKLKLYCVIHKTTIRKLMKEVVKKIITPQEPQV